MRRGPDRRQPGPRVKREVRQSISELPLIGDRVPLRGAFTPGATVLTTIPPPPSSLAMSTVSTSTAPFTAVYPGTPIIENGDEGAIA